MVHRVGIIMQNLASIGDKLDESESRSNTEEARVVELCVEAFEK